MDKRCLLDLKLAPVENCLLGENLFRQFEKPYCKCKNAKFGDEELLNCKFCKKMVVKCPWGINSEKHCFCFWKLLEEGNESRSPTEIGRLLHITVQRVGQISKKTLLFLRQIKIFKKDK